jgi:hypothetical protein
MRAFKPAIFVFVFVLTGPLGQVYAAETSGIIVSVDVNAISVTLESGETFIVKDGADQLVLKIGQRVRITHEPTPKGLNSASLVVPQG